MGGAQGAAHGAACSRGGLNVYCRAHSCVPGAGGGFSIRSSACRRGLRALHSSPPGSVRPYGKTLYIVTSIV